MRRIAVTYALCGCVLLACHRDRSPRPLLVFAPSSTTEVFGELGEAFQRTHPETLVQFAFAGSQTLRLQLEHGARADVFASANEAHVRALASQGLVEGVTPLASTRLTIAVPLDNPAKIATLEDLVDGTRLVIGAPTVPVGAYTEQLFARFGRAYGPNAAAALRACVVSEESNARLVRAKVELGEADAAIVYVTDALASERVRRIPIPDSLNVAARYFVGRVANGTPHPSTEAWMAFLQSETARAILRSHGFRTS